MFGGSCMYFTVSQLHIAQCCCCCCCCCCSVGFHFPLIVGSSGLMARKRGNSSFSETIPICSPSKRPRYRPPPPSSSLVTDQIEDDESNKSTTRQTSSMVLVHGLPTDCSVLNLKSRFEIYGSISRTRIDRGIGYVTFRSKDSAEAAIAAALDPAFGITVDDHKVHVSWPSDPLPQWKEGVRVSVKERLSSKLLQPEVPLRRHGRGNKHSPGNANPKNSPDASFKARGIIAYDDLF